MRELNRPWRPPQIQTRKTILIARSKSVTFLGSPLPPTEI
jgi:hypothetical protein